jgi:hypothetical protein
VVTVLLLIMLATGCNVNSTPASPDDLCKTAGDVCDADQPCCASLTCSNGVCQAPDEGDGVDQPSALALPDFSAEDVNPQSSRYQRAVSPRDYLGQISAWYFGHAT